MKVIIEYLKWLQGRKTYLLSLAALLYAVSGWYIGQIDQATALNMVWAALTAAALRAGIAKNN